MTLRDQLVEQALALPAEDRMFVADALEQSLASSGFATPEIAAAWVAEIEQRIGAYERGEAPGLPLDTSLQRIRRQVAEIHARRVQT